MSEPEPQAADGAEEGVPPLADLLRDGATRAAALDALDAAASVPVDAGPALLSLSVDASHGGGRGVSFELLSAAAVPVAASATPSVGPAEGGTTVIVAVETVDGVSGGLQVGPVQLESS